MNIEPIIVYLRSDLTFSWIYIKIISLRAMLMTDWKQNKLTNTHLLSVMHKINPDTEYVNNSILIKLIRPMTSASTHIK